MIEKHKNVHVKLQINDQRSDPLKLKSIIKQGDILRPQ